MGIFQFKSDSGRRTAKNEVTATLQKLTHIRSVSPSSIVLRPSFWKRCVVVHPKWWYDAEAPYEPIPIVFVDGIVNASKWNCWRAYEQSTDGNLCIWLGYALKHGTWMEHSWCMLGDRIIETEDAHDIYYGAELSPDEYEFFAERCSRSDLSERRNARLWTMDNNWRTMVPYDPVLYAHAIGRQRDRVTNEPKQHFDV